MGNISSGDPINYQYVYKAWVGSDPPDPEVYHDYRYSSGYLSSGTYWVQSPAFTVVVENGTSIVIKAMTSHDFAHADDASDLFVTNTITQNYTNNTGSYVVICHNVYNRENATHGAKAIRDSSLNQDLSICNVWQITVNSGRVSFYVGGIECVKSTEYEDLFKGEQIYYNCCSWWSEGGTFADVEAFWETFGSGPVGHKIVADDTQAPDMPQSYGDSTRWVRQYAYCKCLST